MRLTAAELNSPAQEGAFRIAPVERHWRFGARPAAGAAPLAAGAPGRRPRT